MQPNDESRFEARTALEQFSKDARVETRMLDPNKPVTEEQQRTLISDLKEYRERNLVDGSPMSWAKLATCVGVASSVLSEWAKGKYRGDAERVARMVDRFLEQEEKSGRRPNLREFSSITLIQKLHGAVNQCISRRSIGVFAGEPGSGKTTFATWVASQTDGAVLITATKVDFDAKFISDALHAAFKIGTHAPSARQRSREIIAHVQSHLNTLIIVDEGQHLDSSALEMLRSVHDLSDPTGRRNIPILLFGDRDFYKKVMGSRTGAKSPLSPQITSRMFPVISIESDCAAHDDDGQIVPNSVYTREDIERIVRQQRLRLVRPDAIGWVVKLANLTGWGRLRLAVRVLEIALDIKQGVQVTTDDLRHALRLFIGPEDARIIRDSMELQYETRTAAAAG